MSKKEIKLYCIYDPRDNLFDAAEGKKGWVDQLADYTKYVASQEHDLVVDFINSEVDPEREDGEHLHEEPFYAIVVVSDVALTNANWRNMVGNIASYASHNIVSVIKEPLKDNNVPAKLHDFPILDFYVIDPAKGDAVNGSALLKPPFLNMYLAKVFDLVKEIQEYEKEGALTKPTNIYLALTSYDLMPARDQLRRQLIHNGYNVYPKVAYPQDVDDIEDAILEDLKKCELSVHLIGNYYDSGVYDPELSITEVQNNIAVDYYESLKDDAFDDEEIDFGRIVWFSDRDVILEDKQDKYVRKLNEEERLLNGAEVIRSPLKELKNIIIKKLDSSLASVVGYEEDLSLTTDQRSIYLITRDNNSEIYENLKSILEKHEFTVLDVDISLDYGDFIGIHKQNLLSCDAVIILASNSDLMWLRSKMNDIHKAYNWGRKKLYKCVAVLSESMTELPKESIFDDVLFIKREEKYKEGLLSPFLEQFD